MGKLSYIASLELVLHLLVINSGQSVHIIDDLLISNVTF